MYPRVWCGFATSASMVRPPTMSGHSSFRILCGLQGVHYVMNSFSLMIPSTVTRRIKSIAGISGINFSWLLMLDSYPNPV